MQANYNYGPNTIMVYHLRRYPSAPSLPLPFLHSFSIIATEWEHQRNMHKHV